MNQKEFSEKTGIPRSSLSEIENGKRSPSVDFIIGISNQFKNVNTDWLLTGEGNMYRDEEGEFDPQTLAIARMVKGLDPLEKNGIESFVSDKKFIHEMKRRDMRQSA